MCREFWAGAKIRPGQFIWRVFWRVRDEEICKSDVTPGLVDENAFSSAREGGRSGMSTSLPPTPAGETPSALTAAQKFLRDAATKSADLVHREIIRKSMDSYDAAHQRGRARIKDWEAARRKCQEIKREAINHLDKYLLQFEKKVLG